MSAISTTPDDPALVPIEQRPRPAAARPYRPASWNSVGLLMVVPFVLIFAIFAFGFVVLTLPVGLLFTWLSRRLAVAR